MCHRQDRECRQPEAQPSKVLAEARELAVDFLRSELEVASTLVSVAETTSSCKSALRNLRNAWVALKTAQEFAEKLDLGCSERRAFHDRHGELCLRLANLHVRLEIRRD
jgi:hypothetical protein